MMPRPWMFLVPPGVWGLGVAIAIVWDKLSPGTGAPVAVIAFTSGLAGGGLVELLASPRRHSLSSVAILGSMALIGLFRLWEGDPGGLLLFLLFTGLGTGMALAKYGRRSV